MEDQEQLSVDIEDFTVEEAKRFLYTSAPYIFSEEEKKAYVSKLTERSDDK